MTLNGLHTAVVLAVADTGSSGSSVDLTSILPILNFGLLGIMFVLLISKKFIVTMYYADEGFKSRDDEIARLRKENEEYKKQNADLQTLARDQLFPAVVEGNRLQAELVRVLAESGARYRNGGGGGPAGGGNS